MVRHLKIGAFLLFHVILPPLAALLAFFFSAKASPSVAVLVASAVVVAALVAWGTSRLALGATRARPLAALGSVALVVTLGWLLLFHRPTHPDAPLPPRDAAFVEVSLPTGSKLAVARFPAGAPAPSEGDGDGGSAPKSPLVFLHGGPGGYVRAADLDLLRAIAEQGVEVVAYDQAGGGASPRLGVREYSLARAVADLEALRVHLGADRLSLLGQSWGSMLAFEYASAHPDRVDRLVLTGAGLISSRNKSFAIERTAASGQPSFPPYAIAAMILFKLNPEAAVAFLPREELDTTWKAMMRDNLGRFFCKADAPLVPDAQADLDRWPAADGYQAFALKGEMEARSEAPPVLAAPPPTLIIRGLCDFVPWGAARELRERTKARLVTIPDVGHSIWPKRADDVRDLVVAHLRGAPLTVAAYDGADDPATAPPR